MISKIFIRKTERLEAEVVERRKELDLRRAQIMTELILKAESIKCPEDRERILSTIRKVFDKNTTKTKPIKSTIESPPF